VRCHLSGFVREVAGSKHFSLEVDPNSSLVFSTTCPSQVVIEIADNSPVRSTDGLRNSLVTCSVSNPKVFPLVAKVVREANYQRV
jgi:hypothetical protein